MSPTQPRLSRADVARLADEAFGLPVVECAPLEGGGFAAVWRVLIADGRDLVLKVGPPPRARLLRYEHRMVAAEARYLRLLEPAGLPLPRVVYEGDDWLFTTLLPGTPLPLVEGDTARVREDLGAVIARVHQVTGDRFGYDGGAGPAADNWPDAFCAIIGDVLDDASAWGVPLPRPARAIAGLVAASRDTLSEVDRPALVHFDLWDGNVLALDGRLSGLVDGERHLYGDPLIDVVSPYLTGRIEDEPGHPFRLGYGAPEFTASQRHRIALYRLHLYLLMTVEVPSRGMPEPVRVRRYERLAEVLSALGA